MALSPGNQSGARWITLPMMKKTSGPTKWYIGKRERTTQSSWQGPFSGEEVLKRLATGSLSWADFACHLTNGEAEWMRLCDIQNFQSFAPRRPSSGLIREIQAFAASGKGPKLGGDRKKAVWFLEFQGSEFGPLHESEVAVILKSGRLKGELRGWREGMDDWRLVGDIPALMNLLGGLLYGPDRKSKITEKGSELGPKREQERRRIRRVPLVAAVRFSIARPSRGFEGPFLGICRDINPDGMLILSNRTPSPAARIRVEVTPLGPKGFEIFVAEAELIRVVSDQWGFSVRFLRLKDQARLAIEKYVAGSGRT